MKVFFWKPRIFRDRFKQLTLLAGTLCVLIVPDGVGGLDGVRAGHFQTLMISKRILDMMIILDLAVPSLIGLTN